LTSIRQSRPEEQQRLFEIWSAAVRATHHFLLDADFRFYADIVRNEQLPSGIFWVAADEEDQPIGWLRLDGKRVAGLFVDPARHRSGVGRALIHHARTLSPDLELQANEKSGAVEFYRRLGFTETGRSPADGRGRPYPLVQMRWTKN
jgi:putative acetyltransferase